MINYVLGSDDMDEEKELDISLDKIYTLPQFQIVKYNKYRLAIAVELAKWIVLENESQFAILSMLKDGSCVQDVLEKYEAQQEDVINVLTQIEAKQIESTTSKSIFTNTRLHLHLTNKCNLNCPHCYMHSGTAYQNELTTDEIHRLCHDFYNCGGTHVSLTGGEPTVRSDFFEIAEYISSLGMKVSIFTNGYLWDKDKVEHISKINIEGVQISIDGYDEKTNSTVRGSGVFSRALNAIDLFVKNHIYVKIAITSPYEILKCHQKEYIDFSQSLIEKYGNDAIEINYSYFFMPGRELSSDRIAGIKDEYYKLVDEVVKSIYEDIEEDSFVTNLADCISDSCGFGGLNVMANGDFYFCDRIPDVKKSGNIRSMPFEEIYNLMKIAEKAGKIDNFKPCSACELKYICGGGCRAEFFRSFTETDDITNIDFEAIASRECDIKNKEKFYDLMVKTNERFFC